MDLHTTLIYMLSMIKQLLPSFEIIFTVCMCLWRKPRFDQGDHANLILSRIE